jgi:hypothetical protein
MPTPGACWFKTLKIKGFHQLLDDLAPVLQSFVARGPLQSSLPTCLRMRPYFECFTFLLLAEFLF